MRPDARRTCRGSGAGVPWYTTHWRGDSQGGGVVSRVLHPPAPDWERQRVGMTTQSCSSSSRRRRALLTGDVGADVERLLLPQLTQARVRVLKVGHTRHPYVDLARAPRTLDVRKSSHQLRPWEHVRPSRAEVLQRLESSAPRCCEPICMADHDRRQTGKRFARPPSLEARGEPRKNTKILKATNFRSVLRQGPRTSGRVRSGFVSSRTRVLVVRTMHPHPLPLFFHLFKRRLVQRASLAAKVPSTAAKRAEELLVRASECRLWLYSSLRASWRWRTAIAISSSARERWPHGGSTSWRSRRPILRSCPSRRPPGPSRIRPPRPVR